MIDQLEIVRKKLSEFGLDVMASTVGKSKLKLLQLESERDELKSKLAEFEREIPKTPEGFPELDKDHLIKICIYQQSKLAKIEAQEPLKFAWKHDYGFISNVVFDHWDDANDSWKGKAEGKVVSLYTQPKPSSPAQRITEQDALEIVESAINPLRDVDSFSFHNWLHYTGRSLLDKLNEHREQVTPNKAEFPVQLAGNRTWVKFNGENGEIIESSKDILSVKRISKGNYQLNPNKAEVPDVANEKMLAAGIESLDRGMQNFPENMTQVISNVWEDMYADSLPPLKGDDK